MADEVYWFCLTGVRDGNILPWTANPLPVPVLMYNKFPASNFPGAKDWCLCGRQPFGDWFFVFLFLMYFLFVSFSLSLSLSLSLYLSIYFAFFLSLFHKRGGKLLLPHRTLRCHFFTATKMKPPRKLWNRKEKKLWSCKKNAFLSSSYGNKLPSRTW